MIVTDPKFGLRKSARFMQFRSDSSLEQLKLVPRTEVAFWFHCDLSDNHIKDAS